jgi:TolA-binding protein
MQDKKKKREEKPEKASIESILSDWIASKPVSKLGQRAGIALLVVAIIVSAILYQRKSSGEKVYKRNKLLGPAYIYFSENKLDSAEQFLEFFVSEPHAQLVQSKAFLLLGQSKYFLKKYNDALDAYQKVKGSSVKQSLLTSGALHGMGACYMQIREYHKAIEVLEEFAGNYMRRTGNLQERSAGKEPQDLSPAVPNVLWKLALCYKQVNELEKAKITCEKLTRIYGDTEEAAKAARLLQTI